MEPTSVETRFTQFADRSRIEFSEAGWNLFSNKIAEFHVSLYAGTRRECIARIADATALLYSSADVEQAAIRLDFQRFYNRRRGQNLFRLATMMASLLTGIFGNWAFSDINSGHPSMLPWCLLVVSVISTTAFYHLQVLREIEP